MFPGFSATEKGGHLQNKMSTCQMRRIGPSGEWPVLFLEVVWHKNIFCRFRWFENGRVRLEMASSQKNSTFVIYN